MAGVLESLDRWNRFKLEFESYLKNNKDWFGLHCNDSAHFFGINGVRAHIDWTSKKYIYTIDDGTTINVPFDVSQTPATDHIKAFALFKRLSNNKELC